MPNVLIIDDNQKVSDLIAKFLNRQGMAVAVSHDGTRGLRAFGSGAFDLVLVSRDLPVMNGDAFCGKLRETPQGRDVPVVMMGSFPKDHPDIEVLKQHLALSGFLSRPFTSQALLSVVTSALGSTQAASRSRAEIPPADAARPRRVQGDLDRTPFGQVLFILMKKRATGVLTVTRQPLVRTCVLIRGAAADVNMGPDDADFGDYLSSKKLVDPPELREYKERRRADGTDPRDLFVKMGCLTPDRFEEETRNFLQARLVEFFSWTTGTVLFEPSQPAALLPPAVEVLMPGVFFRGFHAEACSGAVRAFIAEQGKRFPARTEEFYEYQNHLAADASLAALLDLCDGRKTCSEILASADAEEAAILLFTLHTLKAVTFSETPSGTTVSPPFPIRERAAPWAAGDAEMFEDLRGELSRLADEVGPLEHSAPAGSAPEQAGGLSELEESLKNHWQEIRDKNYYEMFGMKQNTFSFDKLKKAYFELTRTYGPEKFFASSGETLALAQEMLSKASNAYDTLSNVVSKESYDELLASQDQVPEGAGEREFYEQIQFQSGKVFVEQGQYESAEKAFTACVNMNPDKAEYLAYLALAVYHNPANRGNPSAIRRAKDTVNRSLQLGKLSIAYALKGTIYLDEGGLNFAEAEFNKALRLNPGNKTALKKLEIIKAKREEEKKGIFQRMFR